MTGQVLRPLRHPVDVPQAEPKPQGRRRPGDTLGHRVHRRIRNPHRGTPAACEALQLSRRHVRDVQHPTAIANTGTGLLDLRDQTVRVGRRQCMHPNLARIRRSADPDNPGLVADFHRHIHRATFTHGRGHVVQIFRHRRSPFIGKGWS